MAAMLVFQLLAPRLKMNQDYDRVSINGKAVKRFNTYIDLSRLPTANLDQVKIDIVRGPNC